MKLPATHGHHSRLVTLQVLLTMLARLISEDLAALSTSFGRTVPTAILRHSQDHAPIRQLLPSLVRRGAAVVRAVAVLGLGPVTASAMVDAVVIVGVQGRSGGGGAGGVDGRARGGGDMGDVASNG